MRLLLDSHTLFWAISEDRRLSGKARRLILAADTRRLLQPGEPVRDHVQGTSRPDAGVGDARAGNDPDLGLRGTRPDVEASRPRCASRLVSRRSVGQSSLGPGNAGSPVSGVGRQGIRRADRETAMVIESRWQRPSTPGAARSVRARREAGGPACSRGTPATRARRATGRPRRLRARQAVCRWRFGQRPCAKVAPRSACLQVGFSPHGPAFYTLHPFQGPLIEGIPASHDG